MPSPNGFTCQLEIVFTPADWSVPCAPESLYCQNDCVFAGVRDRQRKLEKPQCHGCRAALVTLETAVVVVLHFHEFAIDIFKVKLFKYCRFDVSPTSTISWRTK